MFQFGKTTARVAILAALSLMFAVPAFAQDSGDRIYIEFYGNCLGADSFSDAFDGAMVDVETQVAEATPPLSGYESMTIESVTIVENDDGTWDAFVEVDVCYFVWGVYFSDPFWVPR